MSDINEVTSQDDAPIVETSGDAWNDALSEGESLIAEPEALSGAPTISTPLPPPPASTDTEMKGTVTNV